MGAESQQLYCSVSMLASRLFSVSTRTKHVDIIKTFNAILRNIQPSKAKANTEMFFYVSM